TGSCRARAGSSESSRIAAKTGRGLCRTSSARSSQARSADTAVGSTRLVTWSEYCRSGYRRPVIVAGIAVVACVILFAAGFLAPTLSKKPQYRVDKLLAKAAGGATKAPRSLRKLISQPVGKSE